MWSLPKNLKSPGLYELGSQSQTGRQGCHCWKLQDEPLALCRQIGAACVDLRNRVFNTHLIGILLRAIKKERKSALKWLRYYVSPKAVFPGQTPKAVFPASKRQCTEAGGNVKYYRVVLTSDEIRKKGLLHGLVKQMQFCVSFIAPWSRNGGFQRTPSFQYLHWSLFRSSPVVLNHRWLLKQYCQKYERQRCDICKEFSVWHFVTKITGLTSVKPGMSCHFPESSDPIYSMLVRPCVQNVPGKNGEPSPSGYSLHPRESGPKFAQGPGCVTTSPTLFGPVLVWSQQNYLRLLLIVRYCISGPPWVASQATFRKGKAGTIMRKWMSV